MSSQFKKIYKRIEPLPAIGWPLRALTRRYRANRDLIILPRHPSWGRFLALTFALPGLPRFYLFTVRMFLPAPEMQRSESPTPTAEAPTSESPTAESPTPTRFSLQENGGKPCRTLAELTLDSRERIAFELYRNALRTQTLRVVSETLEDYAKSMGIPLRDMPAWRAIERATEGAELAAEYARLLSQAILHVSDFAEAHYALGCELRDQRRSGKALAHFKAAVAGRTLVVPGPMDVPVAAKAHLEIGTRLLAGGKVEKAIEHLERAARPFGGTGPVEEAAAFPAASKVFAEALRRAGRYREAAEHFSLALVYRPTLPELPPLPLILEPSTESGHPPRKRPRQNHPPRKRPH